MMPIAQAKRLVDEQKWYHSFEVIPGLWTAGKHFTPAKKILDDRHRVPQDLSGKTVLDIGALDAAYGFELENRGAKLTALDIQKPDFTGWNCAKKLRESAAEYIQGDCYELVNLVGGCKFDIISFFGVWYHLKHPLRAFEQVAACLKDDGVLLYEGACVREHLEAPGKTPEELKEFARQIADSPVPLTAYYADSVYGDKWSWFVPNAACVQEWLKTAGLASEFHSFGHERMAGNARKIPGAKISVDNPVWGP
ncbi:MAG: methyltransferase domain-containing protein [Alphaproteobacteria bacterium]|nr:methyltransferase domain-containing protein [Alphaproteobacteria bacterium]MBM3641713.1 methyltransferase domain-containing protein [Alphaproteobacteria bacterium]